MMSKSLATRMLAALICALSMLVAACQELDTSASTTTSSELTTTSALSSEVDQAVQGDPTATVESGATDSPSDEGSGGDDSEAVLPDPLYAFPLATAAVPFETYSFDEGDAGHTTGMHVGDHLRVELTIPDSAQVSAVDWLVHTGDILQLVDHGGLSAHGVFLSNWQEFVAASAGSAWIRVTYEYEGTTDTTFMEFYVHVLD